MRGPGGAARALVVRRLATDESQMNTPLLTTKQMRLGPVDSHDVLGRLARLLGR